MSNNNKIKQIRQDGYQPLREGYQPASSASEPIKVVPPQGGSGAVKPQNAEKKRRM